VPITLASRQSRTGPSSSVRLGFTKIELLVVLTVIALLLSLVLPAIQASRESARSSQCQNNLRQFGVALASYEAAHRSFPSMASHKVDLAPYLEITLGAAPAGESYDEFVERVSRVRCSVLVCPSDSGGAGGPYQPTNYGGSVGSGLLKYGSNGFFSWPPTHFPPSVEQTTPAMMRNGMSNVAAMSEFLVQASDLQKTRLRAIWETRKQHTNYDALNEECERLPAPFPAEYGYVPLPSWRRSWVDGVNIYNHALPPNRPSCINGGHVASSVFTTSSLHRAGVNVLFADGHVRIVSSQIDREVWRMQGSRNSNLLELAD
jgi:prepilin-type processing-associated H-X9-DG protein/prepilin-type N-terminal cleavage/methylation domain-containing protein